MSRKFVCDLCGKVYDDCGAIGPVFLTMGLLSKETQNNFERIDLCMERCWPQDRKIWKTAFVESLWREKTGVEKQGEK